MATMNKIVSLFTKTNSGAAKVTQTALPPAVQSIAKTVEHSVLFRQLSSQQPKDGVTIWSPRSGYRTTPLQRQTPDSSASSDTQHREPLSEPPPRYSDSILQDYIPDEKDYTANLGSPIYCCSIFDDASVRPPSRDDRAASRKALESEQVRVLNLEPTEAMLDDFSGKIHDSAAGTDHVICVVCGTISFKRTYTLLYGQEAVCRRILKITKSHWTVTNHPSNCLEEPEEKPTS